MPSSNEIRSLAQQVSSRQSGLRSTFSSGIDNRARTLQSNWKGELGGAFSNSYNRVRNDTNNFFSDFGNLHTKINSLANSVQRAEREDVADKKV